MGIGRVALRADVVEAAEIAPVHLCTDEDRLIEEIGVGEPRRDRLGIKRPIDLGVERLALTHEVVLLNAELNDESLEARITARQRQLAGRLFLDVGAEDDAIGRRALALLDLELVAEIAEALDAVLASLDHQRVESVAFVVPEFTPDDLVAR